jgi:hypothetical protein
VEVQREDPPYFKKTTVAKLGHCPRPHHKMGWRITGTQIDITSNLQYHQLTLSKPHGFLAVSVGRVSCKRPSILSCEDNYRWLPHPLALTLRLGSKLVTRFNFPAVELDVPPTRLAAPFPVPDWRRLPVGSCAAHIEALPVSEPVRRLSVLRGGVCYLFDYEVRHFVDLRDSLAVYLQKLAKKSRSNLTRTERRFTEVCGGAAEFCEYITPQEMAIFAGLADAISSRASKPCAHGFRNTPEARRSLLAQAEMGLVRGYILFHADHPVSYILCVYQQQNIRYHKIGYDARYGHLSPGTVAFYYLLQRLFREKTFEFLDFERLEAPYKQRFATLSIPCWRVAFCRFKPTLLAAIALHIVWSKSLSIIVGLSHRSGLTPVVKRLCFPTSGRSVP